MREGPRKVATNRIRDHYCGAPWRGQKCETADQKQLLQHFEKEKNKAKELIQVEFDKKISKQKLENISGVSRAKSIGETSWLIESSSTVDLRSSVAKFAAKNELLILTLKKEEDKLEDIFKKLTN